MVVHATSTGDAVGEAIRVLFVCSANLCRSVTAAEYARRATFEHPSEWYLESAGTDVTPGQRLPRAVAETMHELGIPPRDHPLMLTQAQARTADLILTAERQHRTIVVSRFPFAVRRTFTMLEFARLLDAARRSTTPSIVHCSADLHELARVGRSLVPSLDGPSIDIGDPVAARSSEAMKDCADAIRGAIATIFSA